MGDIWLSQKGINYVLSPKRGMCTDINPDVCMPITAKGQSNWTGSFISPDIMSISRTSEIGGATPTIINMKNGEVIYYDGYRYY